MSRSSVSWVGLPIKVRREPANLQHETLQSSHLDCIQDPRKALLACSVLELFFHSKYDLSASDFLCQISQQENDKKASFPCISYQRSLVSHLFLPLISLLMVLDMHQYLSYNCFGANDAPCDDYSAYLIDKSREKSGRGRGTKMALSNELQMGKAAEHLVCADLILQGCNAFLADQGLPYDVVVDTDQGLKRVQVKSSSIPVSVEKRIVPVYRYTTRRAKRGDRKVGLSEVDFYAFVALDIAKIAYLPMHLLRGIDGKSVIQCIEFHSKSQYHSTQRNGRWSSHSVKFFEDFGIFPLAQNESVRFSWIEASNSVKAVNLPLWDIETLA